MTMKQHKNIKTSQFSYIAIGTFAAFALGMLVVPYFRKRSRLSTATSAKTMLEKMDAAGDRDAVEEASWESFPASDAPAW